MKKISLAISVIAALSLAGCGNSQDKATPSETGTQSQAAPAAEPAVETTPLSQEEWIELCGEDGTDPENERCFEDMGEEAEGDEMGIPADEVVKIGDEFRINTFDDDNTIYHWDVKVTNFETVDILKGAADNPDYDGGNDLYIDATPQDGNEFVHITYEQTNRSGVPDSLDIEAQLQFSDGEIFAPLEDDYDFYTPNLTGAHDKPAGETQNNETTAMGDWVVEVPKGSEVKAIVITNIYIGDTEEYWVEVA